ncbi:DUF695 domain-containing protein [Modestobacter muralis]|uniref:DUF695 domain-containing protein n=1 Tax=Modestobacter muralis TaxID=1608614 RepID=A0A6P0EW66_9ACTN|nr:DUF695 domain-containing protein [Modestobacter muralis]NEK94164.1 DUF695 domain-containing protein [Modestobacter muralis]NEN50932.1 DUF695 domain-containing protein [Modestobacter muralis]
MALFRRRPADPTSGIAGFWAWWAAGGAAHCAGAIAAGRAESLADVLGPAVEAVHRELSWELGPGGVGEHVLVVTAAGDPALRSVARRWLLAAPAPDAVWEYADSRPVEQQLDWGLSVGGRTVDAADVVATWARTGRQPELDVALHHPALAALPEGTRGELTFLLLDHALGETAVETWVGAIDTLVRPPSDRDDAAVGDLAALRAAVQELAAEVGEDAWALLEATTAGGQPVLAAARQPLRAATAPHLDRHVRVELPYTDLTDGGLPGPASLEPLREHQDDLGARLGADGRVVAHETSGGVRTLHVYVDATTGAADRVQEVVAGWPQGRPRTTVQADPGWQAVRHLRG